MCETTETVSISGSGLAHLLANALIHKEGFLYGDVGECVSNRVSDAAYCNMKVEVSINVKGILPAPAPYSFYTPSGRIKPEVLDEFLSDSASGIIGWYRCRENGSPEPSLRERLVCESLGRHFRKYFVFCAISAKRNVCDSTHTYAYRFSKLDGDGRLERLRDATGNLGEVVSGYKRIKKGDASDAFNEAVAGCARDGGNVAEAVRNLLGSAAEEYVRREAEIREIEVEVQQMTALLADHHRERISSARREAERAERERALAEPLLIPKIPESVEPPTVVANIVKSQIASTLDGPITSTHRLDEEVDRCEVNSTTAD